MSRPPNSRFNRTIKSPRSTARADEHIYRTTGGVAPRPRTLSEAEIAVGMRVLAGGTPGVVELVAWSCATEAMLYVVAHDPRIRLTYRACEITAVA